jgi:hypothetical protein
MELSRFYHSLQIDEFSISLFNTHARRCKTRMKQKLAALYVRVSTGEQHTEAQERGLPEYVQRRGWLPHKIYRDKGTSGATASRPVAGANNFASQISRIPANRSQTLASPVLRIFAMALSLASL